MKASSPITALFVDIGGVLLTNGWDRDSRQAAAEKFGLDYEEMDERHHLTFNIYEEGKISLEEYLDRVVFYRPRPFSREEFRDFIFSRSQPYPEMIDLVRRLRSRYRLKTATVSNEGRELTEYRIQTFALRALIDTFISSCFVHFRKPDYDIYYVALDAAQVPPDQVVYIEDREMFVEVAQSLGLRGILHRDYQRTHDALAELGLSLDEGANEGAEQ